VIGERGAELGERIHAAGTSAGKGDAGGEYRRCGSFAQSTPSSERAQCSATSHSERVERVEESRSSGQSGPLYREARDSSTARCALRSE
jgi:hypothetical protein